MRRAARGALRACRMASDSGSSLFSFEGAQKRSQAIDVDAVDVIDVDASSVEAAEGASKGVKRKLESSSSSEGAPAKRKQRKGAAAVPLKPQLKALTEREWDVDTVGGRARGGGAKRTASEGLLAWYDANKRTLPWRGSTDPYRIWVSEVMSQQTRLATVEEYFVRWMNVFPTVETLAAAELERVKEVWSGLGYYRRAAYLHQGAQYIVQQCRSVFPVDSVDALRKIPGIGPYTAAAIAAICGGVSAAAVDGNLIRVFLRYEGVEGLAANSGKAFKTASAVCQHYIAPSRPGDWNQAVMDLGSAVCTGQKALCGECPLAEHCKAKQLLEAGSLAAIPGCIPLKQVKAAARVECWVVLVVASPTRVAMVRRGESEGVLSGLWECVNERSDGLLAWLQDAEPAAEPAQNKKRRRAHVAIGNDAAESTAAMETRSAAKALQRRLKELAQQPSVLATATDKLLPQCGLDGSRASPVPTVVTHKFSHIHTHLAIVRADVDEASLDAAVCRLADHGREAAAMSVEDVMSAGGGAAVSEQMRRVVRAAMA
eukprot:TRINITY_DN981_c2_g1_i1.p1 TRINITY_DN981_c2_g1~~TRINITY_DN981_c2_g1_i1.p1  ORF type:complete len:543 (+),score=132.75 TRINITY_DN981_c2_g1_i1:64-1692(+)